MHTDIFVCWTAFHMMAARAALSFTAGQHPGRTTILVNASGRRTPDWASDGWSHIIEEPDGGSSGGQFARQRTKARRARKLLRRLEELCPQGSARIAFAHLEDYTANALFFSRRWRRRAEYIALPDGLLNFYEVRATGRRVPYQLAKSFVAATERLAFRPFVGALTGLDREALPRQYAISTGVVRPEKALVIPVEHWMRGSSSKETERRSVLIIGQETDMRFVGREAFLSLWRELGQVVLATLGADACYYKPHPAWDGPPLVADELRRIIPQIQIVTHERPVELLVGELDVRQLVSVLSSALVHSKLLFGDRISAISVGHTAHTSGYVWQGMRSDFARLDELFSRLGITAISATEPRAAAPLAVPARATP